MNLITSIHCLAECIDIVNRNCCAGPSIYMYAYLIVVYPKSTFKKSPNGLSLGCEIIESVL